uniref:CUB and sushi domain-containing protein 3-like n=1 Tax=Crassostrea virginica TaxID=6565 RepID=A0A8B8CS09_CRAVI|nr:CUB and sushi domain-containing protein 3-like [Crassostrea virginica]
MDNLGICRPVQVMISVSCNKPTIPYGTLIQPNQHTYRYNEAVTFSCFPGFRLVGEPLRRCQQSGHFMNLPSCTVVTCSRPEIPNGFIQPDKRTYEYNDTVRFSCSLGFGLIGESVQSCQLDGHFERDLPSCTVATCSRPKIPNAMIHPDKQTYEYNETVRFSCRLGFRLIGTFVKSCQQDGHFEGDLPSCTVITCQRPQLSRELHIASNPFKQTFYYNESVKFQCSAGFSLQGPSVKYCRNNGDFQKDLPTCSNVTCQRPSLSNALQLSGTDPLQQTFSYNESVLFYCSDGFHLQGPLIKYCRQSGDFKYNIPICTAKSSEASFTVGFVSGGLVGVIAITSSAVVFIILRRRVRRKKENENKIDEGRSQESDDKDHQYDGIDDQPNEMEGHYTGISHSDDDKTHQYMELNAV